jgi:hypothetical protein
MIASANEQTNAVRSPALTKSDDARLRRLAARAGRTPQAMLKFVLRDGFGAVETDVAETEVALDDVRKRGTVQHAQVLRNARQLIAAAQRGALEKAA